MLPIYILTYLLYPVQLVIILGQSHHIDIANMVDKKQAVYGKYMLWLNHEYDDNEQIEYKNNTYDTNILITFV